ncbi:phosphoribosylglycinamide formyltransferase, chloroplastic isoform X1 [Lolium perenne]|uniref:phosphoribosylglycinamide formyltransferase, chloroplastic isoform X1 n=1 Tax=Lolium perenne TaxID=4522 RepID=UPI0021EA20FB|nr:phosphoribosylglycinamide formyltransferase, chloroplastic-like isoform X1 [Lolium perenne]XP_051177095.1 phosphoribosylglycinamide formyltransferase, chloroplastic-like isoform X1 [Lolium perenne]
MEAAAVASSGTGLRCSLNPVPNPHKISARVRFTTTRQSCAATCRPLLLLRPTASAYSAAIDSGAGCSGVSKRLAVFVSGGGSNFRSVHEAALGGKVNGHVAVLVTDKPGCGGADYARCNGVPVVVFPKSKSAPEGVSTDQLLNVLRDLKVDFVLLAGYLKLIPGELVQAYPRSMLNIHPSLLPAFGGKGYYGSKVHKAVIASGARYSGPTVHFVDMQFDTGRTLAQRVVPVLANDTPEQLAARVLHEEHQVYVEAVAALCDDRIVWREDGVPLIRSQANPNEYM